jgi:hypothetical protein
VDNKSRTNLLYRSNPFPLFFKNKVKFCSGQVFGVIQAVRVLKLINGTALLEIVMEIMTYKWEICQ